MHIHAGFNPSDNQQESSQIQLPEMPQTGQNEYILQANDRLEHIALQVYGDSSLWYLIADANGLLDKNARAGEAGALNIGQRLIIPPVSVGQHHTSETYKVMDMNYLAGNTSPTLPTPVLLPQAAPAAKKRSIFGKIVVAVISMVATVMTAGILGALSGVAVNTLGGLFSTGFNILSGAASGGLLGMSMGFAAGFAGSIAGQGIANLVGMQKGLDLKSSVINGLANALGGRLPGFQNIENALKEVSSNYFNAVTAAQMMQSDAINQGLSIAFNKQSGFNWAELLATGAAGGILGTKKIQKINNYLASQHGPVGKILNQELRSLAQEGTKSLITGSKFNPAQIAENSIGNALGGTLLESIASDPEPVNFQNRDDLYLSESILDMIHPERTAEEIYQRTLKQQPTQSEIYEGNSNSAEREAFIEEYTNEDPPQELSSNTNLINTELTGNISTGNTVLKLGYEGYKKYQVAKLLNRAGKLNIGKMKKVGRASDLLKAEKLFKTNAKSVAILKEGQNFAPYKMTAKLGGALNVLYVGGEAYNAYVSSDPSTRGREVTAATTGALVEVGGGAVSTHAGGVLGVIITSTTPFLTPVGYAIGAGIANLTYNVKFSSGINKIASRGMTSVWNKGANFIGKAYFKYSWNITQVEVKRNEINWINVTYSNKA